MIPSFGNGIFTRSLLLPKIRCMKKIGFISEVPMVSRTMTTLVFFCICRVGLWGAENDPVKFIPGSSQQIRAVSTALNFVGTPYKLGGTDEKGFDCSGLVQASLRELIPHAMPRTSKDLFLVGKSIDGPLLPGDLVFFDTGGGPSHVGIFSGEGRFIHAASEGPKTGVIVSSLSESYYKSRYLGARRILAWTMPAFQLSPGPNKEKISFPRKFVPETPLGFRVLPVESGSSTWKLSMTLNGESYMTKRMKLDRDSGGFVWIVTQAGKWEVTMSDDGNKNSLTLAFSVEASE